MFQRWAFGGIINALAQLPGLKVTARTSAFAFRGTEQDIRKIAEALDVRTILEGSVRRSGNRIRVTAQLIDARDGYHLWSQRYDREMADIFDIQDEIATAIAGALQVKLAPKPAGERYKPGMPAYEAWLRGRHHLLKLTAGAWERARDCLEQAIAPDPKFAPAYAELAGLFNQAVAMGMRPSQETVPQMRVYAEKALELDPSLPASFHALRARAGVPMEGGNHATPRPHAMRRPHGNPTGNAVSGIGDLWHQERPVHPLQESRRNEHGAADRTGCSLSPRRVQQWRSIGLPLGRRAQA